MPQINGTITDDGVQKITTFTGNVTNKNQTFYFAELQDSMVLTNNGNSVITLVAGGRSYVINPNNSISVYEPLSSFNIVKRDPEVQTFTLNSFLFYSGSGEMPVVVPNPERISVEDNLTSVNIKSALSANQGRVLKGLVDTNTTNIGNKLDKSSVEDVLTSSSSTNALSANQGRVLNEQLMDKVKKGELFVNVKDYGAKGDGVTDDTDSIQSAINYAISNKIGTVFIPSGLYLVNGTITITSSVNLTGVYRIGISKTDSKGGTVILAGNTTNNPVVNVDFGDNSTRINGFLMKDITFLGSADWNTPINRVDRPCLRFFRIAREFQIQNVHICGFVREGIKADSLWDGTVLNTTIIGCGLSNTYPAISLTGTSGATENCNAIRFISLHMEFCQWFLNIDKARHIQFIGGKFEVGAGAGNSVIQLTTNAKEIVFESNQFIIADSDNTTYWADPTLAPYFFLIQNQFCTISNNMFATPLTTGAKWINATNSEGNGIKITNNDFFYCYGGDYSIKLGGGNRFTGNNLTINTFGGTKRYGITTSLSENLVTNNVVSGTGTPTEGYIFSVTGSGSGNIFQHNTIKGNVFQSFLNSSTSKSNFFKTHYESFVALQNVATPSIGKDVSATNNYLVFNVSPVAITDLLDGSNGKLINILYTGAGTLVITHGTTIKLKGSINASLTTNCMISLTLHSGVWYEVSRNF